ncbi:MAG TPA: AsnC family transcriptional regulator [Methanoregulaceae archaeon]|nr:AsnC family transcriptional regulator [Methanoregulaceae archaeon]
MNAQPQTDALDIRILDALQQDIPLVAWPWEDLAGRLGIPESVLLERLERLHCAGIIRGISPVIESRPLGLTAATLVALPVPGERIREVAGVISGYPEVSHNFQRDHHYSLWFTLSAKDAGSLHTVLEEIIKRTGFSHTDILNLPTIRKIKIDVRFPLPGKRTGGIDGTA